MSNGNDDLSIVLGIQFSEQDASKNLKQVINKIEKSGNDLNFKIGVDDEALESKLGAISKSAKRMMDKATGNIDIKINNTSLDTLEKKLKELKKSSYELKDLKIETIVDDNGITRISKALLSYKDNLGKTINEAMRLKTEIDKVTNRPIQVFRTDKITYGNNLDAVDKAYANDKKAVYNELMSLQRQEYSLKEKMVGTEGKLRDILSEQVKLNRQKQGEMWNYAGSKGFKNEQDSNRYLLERQGLNDKLIVSQTKYNQKLEETRKKFKDTMSLRLDSFAGKYKDFIPQGELTSLKNKLENIDKLKFDNVKKEIIGIENAFKELQINTRVNQGMGGSLTGMFGELGSTIKSIPVLLGLGNITGYISSAFTSTIGFIKNFDTALTDLTKVVDLSKNQMDKATESAMRLGKELGQSSIDIMSGMAEFGRVTKNLSEIDELTRVATMSANVTDLNVEESARALNTSMTAFNVSAKDSMSILDGWNNIQNNFRRMMCGNKIFSN